MLPGLIGWGRTRWLLLSGEAIDAAQALAWGLVEEIVAPDDLDVAIERLLGSILAAGPRAVRLQKKLIDAWEGLPLGAGVAAGIDSLWTHGRPTSRPA